MNTSLCLEFQTECVVPAVICAGRRHLPSRKGSARASIVKCSGRSLPIVLCTMQLRMKGVWLLLQAGKHCWSPDPESGENWCQRPSLNFLPVGLPIGLAWRSRSAVAARRGSAAGSGLDLQTMDISGGICFISLLLLSVTSPAAAATFWSQDYRKPPLGIVQDWENTYSA